MYFLHASFWNNSRLGACSCVCVTVKSRSTSSFSYWSTEINEEPIFQPGCSCITRKLFFNLNLTSLDSWTISTTQNTWGSETKDVPRRKQGDFTRELCLSLYISRTKLSEPNLHSANWHSLKACLVLSLKVREHLSTYWGRCLWVAWIRLVWPLCNEKRSKP